MYVVSPSTDESRDSQSPVVHVIYSVFCSVGHSGQVVLRGLCKPFKDCSSAAVPSTYQKLTLPGFSLLPLRFMIIPQGRCIFSYFHTQDKETQTQQKTHNYSQLHTLYQHSTLPSCHLPFCQELQPLTKKPKQTKPSHRDTRIPQTLAYKTNKPFLHREARWLFLIISVQSGKSSVASCQRNKHQVLTLYQLAFVISPRICELFPSFFVLASPAFSLFLDCASFLTLRFPLSYSFHLTFPQLIQISNLREQRKTPWMFSFFSNRHSSSCSKLSQMLRAFSGWVFSTWKKFKFFSE